MAPEVVNQCPFRTNLQFFVGVKSQRCLTKSSVACVSGFVLGLIKLVWRSLFPWYKSPTSFAI